MAKKMTDDELASKLSNEIESASGDFNTELSEQRENAMKYYLGEPFGNEIEGRSEIVTTDVRDTIEYIMPSLMRIFIKHFWEEKKEVSHETYENLTEIEYQSILANDDLEVVEHTETIIQKQQVDDYGTLISPKVVEHDVKVKRTKIDGQVKVVSVPPEEFLISRRATSVEDASFVCHRVKKSISDLILEGYPKSLIEELKNSKI